jgi:acylphosphatase
MLLLTAIVSEKVQHVGYRSRVVTMARTLDLKGYVKNLADDRVLVVAEGERPDLERFCRAIRMEDPLIKVEDIQVRLSEPKGAWDEFYKKLYLFREWQRLARDVLDRCLKKKPWER